MSLKSKAKLYWQIIRQTLSEFGSDQCLSMAAALSYYTLFSIAPMLIVIYAAASLFWGDDAVRGELHGQLRSFVGEDSATMVQGLMQRAYQPKGNVLATIIGLVTLVLGATTVFTQLQSSLNRVWKVKAKPASGWGGIWEMIRDRLLSFAMLLGIAFILLVSMLVSAAIQAAFNYLSAGLPEVWMTVSRIAEFVFSFAVITVLFAMMFKLLPDANVPWRVVWLGAVVTTVLFNVGKYLIGLYLGKSQVGSVYGSAGALVLFILWVNYSSILLFLGAEFTYVHAKLTGRYAPPTDYAVKVEKQEREIPKRPPHVTRPRPLPG